MPSGGAPRRAVDADGPIQLHYVDALGARHEAPRATIEAIHKAIGKGQGTRHKGQGTRDKGKGKEGRAKGSRPVRVVTVGERVRLGPAEVVLEDGTSIAIDDELPATLPAGYHDLLRKDGARERLIVAPRACFLPSDFRAWGWAIQLYAARSRRSWGIGDLADLRALARWTVPDGAGIALINPLAASMPLLPQQPSPYFPSSRRFRSPLYLRVEEVEGAREVGGIAALAARGRALNAERQINRDAVFQLKLKALERIWRLVRRQSHPRFERYRAEQAGGLRTFAIFCAFAEKFGSGWHAWPAALQHPDADAVQRTAASPALADRVRFHEWLQYQIDRQLERASSVVPVMQDLPIGFDADGADAWAFQDVLAQGFSVGAPPDEFNTRGQNWGLPPFVPDRLREANYQPFIDTIRGGLAHAGGLRIDHVMGLFRLFWIPDGMEPRDGAYVRSAARDLLAIVALESQRARAVIVGEDLGTVEEAARADLSDRKILSYRLVWFEKDPPSRFPKQALAAITTHDLPTVAGLWSGSDLDAQRRIALSPNEAGTQEIRARVARMTKARARTRVETIVARVHAALGSAPSRIVTATLDDAMAVEERPNMPATMTEWPNWQLALPRPIETLQEDALARRIARALAKGRKKRTPGLH
ncbi:MAG: 4-alpha-glucanotransferase [Acidobacteria bacterium]|nr:4-alpha-glucanotransferase [Acidobacteriota bacterium]